MEANSQESARIDYEVGLDFLASAYEICVKENNIDTSLIAVACAKTIDGGESTSLYYNFTNKEFYVRTRDIAGSLPIHHRQILSDIVDIQEDEAHLAGFTFIHFFKDIHLHQKPHSEPMQHAGDLYIPLSMAYVICSYYCDESNDLLGNIIGDFQSIEKRLILELKSIGLY